MKRGSWIGILSAALIAAVVGLSAPTPARGDTPAREAIAQAEQVYEDLFGEGGSLAWLVAGEPPGEMTTWDAPWMAAVQGDLGPTDYVTNADSGSPFGVDLGGLEEGFSSEGYVRVTAEDSDTAIGMFGGFDGDAASLTHDGAVYASLEAGPMGGYAAGIDTWSNSGAAESSLDVTNGGDILVEGLLDGLVVEEWMALDLRGINVSGASSIDVTNTGTVFVVGEADWGMGTSISQAGVSVYGDVGAGEVRFSNSGTIGVGIDDYGSIADSASSYGVALRGSTVEGTNSGLITSHVTLEDSTSWSMEAVGMTGYAEPGEDSPGADLVETTTSLANEAGGTIAALAEASAEPGSGSGDAWAFYDAMALKVQAEAEASGDADSRAEVTATNAGNLYAEADTTGYDSWLLGAAGAWLEAGANAEDGEGSASATFANSGTVDSRVSLHDGSGNLVYSFGAYLGAWGDGGGTEVSVDNSGTISSAASVRDGSLSWLQVGGVALRGEDVSYGGGAADGSVSASASVYSTTFYHDDDNDEDPLAVVAGIAAWDNDQDPLVSASIHVGAGGSVTANLDFDDVDWEDAGEDTEVMSAGIHVMAGDGGDEEGAGAGRDVMVANEGHVASWMIVVNSADNGSVYRAAGALVDVTDNEGMDVSLSNTGTVQASLTAQAYTDDSGGEADGELSAGSYETGGLAAIGDVASATVTSSGAVRAFTTVYGIEDDRAATVVGGAQATGIAVEAEDADIEVDGVVQADTDLFDVTIRELSQDVEVGAFGVDVTTAGDITAHLGAHVSVDLGVDGATWDVGGDEKVEAEVAGVSLVVDDTDGDGTASSIVAASSGDVTAGIMLRDSVGDAVDYTATGLLAEITDDDGGDVSVTNEGTVFAYASSEVTGDEPVEASGSSSTGHYAVTGIRAEGDVDSASVDSTGTVVGEVEVEGTGSVVLGVDLAGIAVEAGQVSLASSGVVYSGLAITDAALGSADGETTADLANDGILVEAGGAVTASLGGTVAAVTELSGITADDSWRVDTYAAAILGGAADAGVTVDNTGDVVANLSVEDAEAPHQEFVVMGLDAASLETAPLSLLNDGTIHASVTESNVTGGPVAGYVFGAFLENYYREGGSLDLVNQGTLSADVELSNLSVDYLGAYAAGMAGGEETGIVSSGDIELNASLTDVEVPEDAWGFIEMAALRAQSFWEGGGVVEGEFSGNVVADVDVDGLTWGYPGGSFSLWGIYLEVPSEGLEAAAGSVGFDNSGSVLVSADFLGAGDASYEVTGVRLDGWDGAVYFTNSGTIATGVTIGGDGAGNWEVYGALLSGSEVDFENEGTISVQASSGSGATLEEWGVYVADADTATFVNDGTISVLGNGTGCAICFAGVGAATLDSPGLLYTGTDVHALSVVGGSAVTLAGREGGTGTFTWAVAGDPDEIARPIYVDGDSTLNLNGATFSAYLTPQTQFGSPYWLIEAEEGATVLGSFGSLDIEFANPDFGARLLGEGAESRLLFSYVPRRAIGIVSPLAGIETVHQVMSGMMNYQKMEFGWRRQLARASRPVQVASLRPYVGSISPAAMEQRQDRSTFYVRPLFGGTIDASDLGYNATSWGFEAGYRYDVTERLSLGLFYDYGETSVDMTESGYQDNGEHQAWNAWGAFARYGAERFYGMLAVSMFNVDHEYQGLTGADLEVVEQDDYNSDVFDARIELGWAFDMGKWSLVPNLGFSWTNWQTDPHGTTATDTTWNRRFGEYDEDFTEVSLGVDLNRAWVGEESTVTFFAGLKLADMLSGDETSIAQWVPGMSTPRIELVEDVSDFSVIGNLGIMAQKDNLRLTIGVAERYNSDYTSFSGYAQIGYRF